MRAVTKFIDLSVFGQKGVRVSTYVLLFIGLLCTLLTSLQVYNVWRVAVFSDRYLPRTFVVGEVFLRHGRRAPPIYGEGRVGGTYEQIGLVDFGPYPDSQSKLRRMYPPGSEIEVWYDPSASTQFCNGRILRLLPRRTNLQTATRDALWFTIKVSLPLLVGALLMACLIRYDKLQVLGARVDNNRQHR